MKIHLISTPEYSKANIDSVVEVLNQVPGELEFQSGEPLTNNQIALGNKKFKNPEKIEFLTFDEFFYICDVYRAIKPISDDEFVVVLSTIQNDKEWFSAFSGKDIFVNTNGWEYITENDGKYGIAYQVVENIFQTLSGIDINNVENEPNIHGRSIGCINDMNDLVVEDVILKLRTGIICKSCQNRARENGISENLLVQIQDIIQYIRDELMKDILVKPELKPEKVKVFEKGKVTIGDKEITIEALPNTLFIFFLENPEGIFVGNMADRESEVLEIYRKIKKGGEAEKIVRLCKHHDDNDSTFLHVKWDLNKTLVNKLGRRNSEFYLIRNIKDGKKSKYKINLTTDYIHIDSRF